MSATFAAVVIGTRDPMELAAFYRRLLGWDVVHEAPEWVRLRDPQRERPGLSFQLEPADVAPTWPPRAGGVQLQAHLDVMVDDLDVEVARAVDLGATVVAEQSEGLTVLRDPHGHVLCLFVQEF